MVTHKVIHILLFLSAISTTLVAGILLAFSTVIMPGLKQLGDTGFLRAFQAIDGVIQRGQPLFGLLWIGSILTTTAAAGLGLYHLAGWPKWILLLTAIVSLVGVQLPTFAIHIPRNNHLQTLSLETIEPQKAAAERAHFEPTWNRWNHYRTVAALAVAITLILLYHSL